MVMEQSDLSQMLETAIVAARLAGQKAMEDIDFVKASYKNNNSEIVTQTDIRCQELIVARIKETYPDHGFIAEEGPQGGIFKQTPRGAEQVWWVIDPIDGTNNYARRIPIFAISIAAMFEGLPIVGVIFEPATDSMYTAVENGQAQLNDRRISASEEVMDKFSSVGLDTHIGSEIPPWMRELMLKTRFRSLGSTALQLAYVAKGGFIATIHAEPKLWDIAAGALIAEAAGAVVTDWQGNKIFPVNLDSYQGQKFPTVAANRKVHSQIIELIKSH